MALRQLDAWLEGRPLDDASLAAYLGHLHEAGRAPATATMVVATVKRSARDPTGGRADVRRLVGSCVAAVRKPATPRSHQNRGMRSSAFSVDQINRRFAAACAAAGLERVASALVNALAGDGDVTRVGGSG